MNHKQLVGRFGETLAKNYLIRHGYKIIDANVKLSYLEVDIVAQKHGQTIFIEVKTRISQVYGPAEDALVSFKLQRFKRGVEIYVGNHHLDIDDIRGDLITVDIDREKKIARLKQFKDVI
jgi:putative endonuclease